MIRVVEILPDCETHTDVISLDSTARYRRRVAMTSNNGIKFLLNLPKPRLLHHGEGLELEDGRIIKIEAAPEPLLTVRGHSTRHLVALAWQIGNRHLEAQIEEDQLLIRRDPVIRDMLKGLGAEVVEVESPFNPEGGAYSGGHHHSPNSQNHA